VTGRLEGNAPRSPIPGRCSKGAPIGKVFTRSSPAGGSLKNTSMMGVPEPMFVTNGMNTSSSDEHLELMFGVRRWTSIVSSLKWSKVDFMPPGVWRDERAETVYRMLSLRAQV